MHHTKNNFKKIKLQGKLALMLSACLFSIGCAHPDGQSNESKPAQYQRNLTGSDSFAIGNGVNLQPSYYNQGKVDFAWPLMQSKDKIKTVRLEIEPDRVLQATDWISQASKAGYTIIATYHKSKILGSNDPAVVRQAASWWQQNYERLISGLAKNEHGHTDSSRLIINLINEWGNHKVTPASYATTYNNAIATIRTFYQGYIIIDIPGWGQETYTAYQACKTSNPRITDPKIVLSAHIYKGGYNQGRGHTLEPKDLEDMQKTGYPCIVGEFGTGQGPCHWDSCVDYAKKLGWPVIAWCWNGDGGTMNMVKPAWKVMPSAGSYGFSTYFDSLYQHL